MNIRPINYWLLFSILFGFVGCQNFQRFKQQFSNEPEIISLSNSTDANLNDDRSGYQADSKLKEMEMPIVQQSYNQNDHFQNPSNDSSKPNPLNLDPISDVANNRSIIDQERWVDSMKTEQKSVDPNLEYISSEKWTKNRTNDLATNRFDDTRSSSRKINSNDSQNEQNRILTERYRWLLNELTQIAPQEVEQLRSSAKAAMAENRSIEPVLHFWEAELSYLRNRPKRLSSPNGIRQTSDLFDPILDKSNVTDDTNSLPDRYPIERNPEKPSKLLNDSIPSSRSNALEYTPKNPIDDLSDLNRSLNVREVQQNQIDPDQNKTEMIRLANRLNNDFEEDAEQMKRNRILSRFLYLFGEDRDEALRPIPELSIAESKFWTKMIYATSQQMNDRKYPNSELRAQETVNLLSDAAAALNEIAPLSMSKPIFCTDVMSFGDFKEFTQYEFVPGQPLLVYWEVDNFVSRQNSNGMFQTRLKGYLEIRNRNNGVEWQSEHTFPDDLCRRYRSDFFNVIQMVLPKSIAAGEYSLVVRTEDMATNKIAERIVGFRITPAGSKLSKTQ